MFRNSLAEKRIKFYYLARILFFIHICENIFAVFLSFVLFKSILVIAIKNNNYIILLRLGLLIYYDKHTRLNASIKH